jgi:peptide/nickel transport system substrate-binding protein
MPLRIFIFCLVLTLAFLLMTGCSGDVQTSGSNSTSTLTYGLGSEPGNIDPHISSEDETAIVLRQIYDTLVYRDPHQETIIPGLATKWTISPDNLVYTFSLRKDVHFHDGTPFNSQAVADNFERITGLNSSAGKAGALLLKYYAGAEIVDEFTIRLKLSQPYAPFLDVLSQPYLGIASPSAFKAYSSNRYQFHQVGTGPFIFVDYIPGKHITLRRNPDYKWGPTFYLPVQNNSVNEAEFLFVPTAKQRLESINSGNVDVVTNLLPNDARTLTINPNIRIVPIKIAGQPLQFLINTSRFPTDNLSFRQALLYSANRNFILDTVFQRFSSVGWSPITSNMLYYNSQLEGSYAADTGKAQGLLASIGYQDTDNNKYLDLGGAEATVTVVIQSGDLYPDIARDLTEQWQLIGIKANVVALPTLTALKARVDTNDYNLIAFSTVGTDPALLDDFFAPDSQFNWSKVSDTQLASLLTQGIANSDSTVRLNAYSQVQQVIMNQALILPVGEPTRLDAVGKSIQQLEFDSLGVPLLNNVTIES